MEPEPTAHLVQHPQQEHGSSAGPRLQTWGIGTLDEHDRTCPNTNAKGFTVLPFYHVFSSKLSFLSRLLGKQLLKFHKTNARFKNQETFVFFVKGMNDWGLAKSQIILIVASFSFRAWC